MQEELSEVEEGEGTTINVKDIRAGNDTLGGKLKRIVSNIKNISNITQEVIKQNGAVGGKAMCGIFVMSAIFLLIL